MTLPERTLWEALRLKLAGFKFRANTLLALMSWIFIAIGQNCRWRKSYCKTGKMIEPESTFSGDGY